eukprot:gb/GECH01008919.1/.p1 GENE.gb/GECH01008919.1/~~gb/GECH01008919.1/.p1  ORF type:complete len:179 (+),score=11.77 gb/GECH01008919.1/:1-537(+)
MNNVKLTKSSEEGMKLSLHQHFERETGLSIAIRSWGSLSYTAITRVFKEKLNKRGKKYNIKIKQGVSKSVSDEPPVKKKRTAPPTPPPMRKNRAYGEIKKARTVDDHLCFECSTSSNVMTKVCEHHFVHTSCLAEKLVEDKGECIRYLCSSELSPQITSFFSRFKKSTYRFTHTCPAA